MIESKFGKILDEHMYTDGDSEYFGMPANTEITQELAEYAAEYMEEAPDYVYPLDVINEIVSERHRILLGREASRATGYDADELIAIVANGDCAYKELQLEKADAANETMLKYDSLIKESHYK